MATGVNGGTRRAGRPANAKAIRAKLARRARRAGLPLAPGLLVSLGDYLDLLTLWNEKINLTAFQLHEPADEAIDRLIMEPLLAARQIAAEARRLIDIGSGSGSPAIPMCLATPHLMPTLVEAKTRKAVFLREALRKLELSDAVVEATRFEQLLTRPELHEAFDLLSIRAVRVEGRTLRTLQAFLKPGGEVFWFRGPSGQEMSSDVMPPLTWDRTVPLVESLHSRLVVLRKQR